MDKIGLILKTVNATSAPIAGPIPCKRTFINSLEIPFINSVLLVK